MEEGDKGGEKMLNIGQEIYLPSQAQTYWQRAQGHIKTKLREEIPSEGDSGRTDDYSMRYINKQAYSKLAVFIKVFIYIERNGKN